VRIPLSCVPVMTVIGMMTADRKILGTIKDEPRELKEAMLVADKLTSVYAAEIKQFADLLLAKRKLSKDECAEWARTFQRKSVSG